MGEKRMKTVYDIMQEKNADFNRSVFMQKQQLPYEAKVTHAKARAIEFYNEIVGKRGENVHVSVGGLDSITLLMFLRKVCHLDGTECATRFRSESDKERFQEKHCFMYDCKCWCTLAKLLEQKVHERDGD